MDSIQHIPSTSASPGQKYSYKPANPTESSSVVILRDGAALEIRRGTKTSWSAGEERRRWPSLEAWIATLPAGAQPVNTSGTKGSTTSKNSTDMDRVLAALYTLRSAKRCVHGDMTYTKSRAETQKDYDKWCELMIAGFHDYVDIAVNRRKKPHMTAEEVAQIIAEAQEDKARHIAEIKKRTEERKARLKHVQVEACYRFRPKRHIWDDMLYYKKADGSMTRIGFHIGNGVFALCNGFGRVTKCGSTFAELGLPADVEIWAKPAGTWDIKRLF
jgi:hypothetical protein